MDGDTITGGLASQLEPRSEPVTGAILTAPRNTVRENGPGGEPGVVAKDSPGPGVMNDAIDPDPMPADGELRHDKASVPAPRRAA